MGARIPFVGCGILEREVAWLARKNDWPIDMHFLDSSLHVDFERLEAGLTAALSHHPQDTAVVLYGACHPRIERILAAAGACGIGAQNCVELLLGKTEFTQELANGAFFLLEEWVLRWDQIIKAAFGDHPAIIREIFREDRKYLLCLRTPCSGDFGAKAIEVSRSVGLPARWRDVSLGYLESVITDALKRRRETDTCPK